MCLVHIRIQPEPMHTLGHQRVKCTPASIAHVAERIHGLGCVFKSPASGNKMQARTLFTWTLAPTISRLGSRQLATYTLFDDALVWRCCSYPLSTVQERASGLAAIFPLNQIKAQRTCNLKSQHALICHTHCQQSSSTRGIRQSYVASSMYEQWECG